jgi:hypothetical protein
MFSGKPVANLMACKVQVQTYSSDVMSVLGSSDVVEYVSTRIAAGLDPSPSPMDRFSIVLSGNFSPYHSSAGAIKQGYVTFILDKSFPDCCSFSHCCKHFYQSTL